MNKISRFSAAILMVVAGALSAAADEATLTLGSVRRGAEATVRVPIHAKVDVTSGVRLQGVSIKVRATPADSIQSIVMRRAGITAALTPIFSAAPVDGHSASLIMVFDAATNPIPYGSTGAPEGDLIAEVEVVLKGAGPVELKFDPVLTTLSNQEGTLALTQAAGTLALVDGGIDLSGGKRRSVRH